MTRFSLLIAAAAIVGFAGTANADQHPTPVACASASATGDNPGDWFKALSDTSHEGNIRDKFEGLNPAEIADHPDVSQETVGVLIQEYCLPD